jgi:hypothetical protein
MGVCKRVAGTATAEQRCVVHAEAEHKISTATTAAATPAAASTASARRAVTSSRPNGCA